MTTNFRVLLWIEMLLLYGGIPLLLWAFPEPRWLIHLTLWCMVFYTLATMRGGSRVTWNNLLHGMVDEKRLSKADLLVHGVFFSLATVSAIIFTMVYAGDRLWAFPRQNPAIWGAVMLFYPLLSALPQEVVFRSFFFLRYRGLIANPTMLIVLNIALFAYSHIMFRNWVALLICAVGGFIFALAYQRRSSLLWTAALHALYGNMVFTVGLGRFFFLNPPL